MEHTVSFEHIHEDSPSIVRRLKTCFKAKTENKEIIIYSIKIPTDLIEDMAEKKGLLVSLRNMESVNEVRVPFMKKNKHLYTIFDERIRIEAIYAILEEEINFDTLEASGVITYHGPLHFRGSTDIGQKIWKD